MLAFLSLAENDEEKSLLERLYITYKDEMFSLSLSILRDEMLAEDVVQDAFLKLAQKHLATVGAIENERDRRSYLLKMTKNMSLNKLKKRKREVLREEVSELRGERADDGEPLEELLESSRLESLRKAVKSLDRRYVDLIWCNYVLKLSLRETAGFLGRPEKTVRAQMTRCRKLLRRAVETEEGSYDED